MAVISQHEMGERVGDKQWCAICGASAKQVEANVSCIPRKIPDVRECHPLTCYACEDVETIGPIVRALDERAAGRCHARMNSKPPYRCWCYVLGGSTALPCPPKET